MTTIILITIFICALSFAALTIGMTFKKSEDPEQIRDFGKLKIYKNPKGIFPNVEFEDIEEQEMHEEMSKSIK